MLFKSLMQPGIAGHSDPIITAETMVNHSPKLGWLAGYLAKRCILGKRKVLIFCHWPFTEQEVETFLKSLQFRVLATRSSHTFFERNRNHRWFNDPKDDGEVLVTSIHTDDGLAVLYCARELVQREYHETDLLYGRTKHPILLHAQGTEVDHKGCIAFVRNRSFSHASNFRARFQCLKVSGRGSESALAAERNRRQVLLRMVGYTIETPVYRMGLKAIFQETTAPATSKPDSFLNYFELCR